MCKINGKDVSMAHTSACQVNIELYCIQGRICKIVMNCGKFHVTCDVMLLLPTILLVDWHLVVMFVAGSWLLLTITITTVYLIASEGHAPR